METIYQAGLERSSQASTKQVRRSFSQRKSAALGIALQLLKNIVIQIEGSPHDAMMP